MNIDKFFDRWWFVILCIITLLVWFIIFGVVYYGGKIMIKSLQAVEYEFSKTKTPK